MLFNFILINLIALISSSKDPDILETIIKKVDKKNFKIQVNPTLNEKIINGETADLGNFPFMLSLGILSQDSYFHRCGGTIISNKYIITAAHCVKDLGDSYNFTSFYQEKKRVLVVVTGTETITGLNFMSLFDQGNIYLVNNIKVNPSYVNVTNPNDIAILTINKLVSFSPSVFGISLPMISNPSVIFGQTATTLGWGLTELGFLATKLLKTRLDVLNGTPLQSECGSFYTDNYCVKDTSGRNSNVCFGDSGGPLIKFENDKWVFYGITSFVIVDENRKCVNTAPSFFSMVPKLMPWISTQIKI